MKTETLEATGGIGVVTVGKDPGKPILLVVHGAKLDGTHETVRAELTHDEANRLAVWLQELADEGNR